MPFFVDCPTNFTIYKLLVGHMGKHDTVVFEDVTVYLCQPAIQFPQLESGGGGSKLNRL